MHPTTDIPASQGYRIDRYILASREYSRPAGASEYKAAERRCCNTLAKSQKRPVAQNRMDGSYLGTYSALKAEGGVWRAGIAERVGVAGRAIAPADGDLYE